MDCATLVAETVGVPIGFMVDPKALDGAFPDGDWIRFKLAGIERHLGRDDDSGRADALKAIRDLVRAIDPQSWPGWCVGCGHREYALTFTPGDQFRDQRDRETAICTTCGRGVTRPRPAD